MSDTNVVVTTPEVCKGTGKRPRANAPIGISASTSSRFKCYYCKKFITLKMDGTFMKHRSQTPEEKAEADKKKRMGTCAQCRGAIYGTLDYLCPDCRGKIFR